MYIIVIKQCFVERVQHSQTERIWLLLTEPVNNCALPYTSLPV